MSTAEQTVPAVESATKPGPKFYDSRRQAILTRYHGATNYKGSRLSATCAAGRVTVSYDHALNISGNHEAAARALVSKLDWGWRAFAGGTLPSQDMAWVDAGDVVEATQREH